MHARLLPELALEPQNAPPERDDREAGCVAEDPPSIMEALVPSGRLAELCGGEGMAAYSAATALLVALQRRREHVAWIAPRGAGLYPPDLARAGIILDALLVVHVPDDHGQSVVKAAEILLRTGVMGGLVLDLTGVRDSSRNTSWMGRLAGVARDHETRVALLSPWGREGPSLGPLVPVRLASRFQRGPDGVMRLQSEVLRDKTGEIERAPRRGSVVAMRRAPIEPDPGGREAGWREAGWREAGWREAGWRGVG